MREEHDNLLEIQRDMEETKENEQEKMRAVGVLFESKNSDFLNKELSFFIENLRKVPL